MTTNLIASAPAFTSNTGSGGALNVVTKVEPPYLVHGAVLRTLSLTPPTSGTAPIIDAVWIGPAAKSGDGYDFDGTQVQVQFGGGAGVTLTVGGGDHVSDDISMTIDATRPLLMAFHVTNSANMRTRTGEFSVNAWTKAGADDTSTTDKTGYSTTSNFNSLKSLNVDMPSGDFSFAGRGTRAGQSFGTSLVFSSTIGLPVNRQLGSLLIAEAHANINTTFTWPGDWTVISNQHQSGSTTEVAYRFVDGSETAPTVTWTGSQAAHGLIAEYRGTLAGANAIGNKTLNNGNSSTASGTSPATTSPNSKILAIAECTNFSPTNADEASGYSVIGVQTNISFQEADVATQGGSAAAFSLALSPAQIWIVNLIEIRSEGASRPHTSLPNPCVG